MRRGPGTAYRRWKSLQYLLTRDRRDVLGFLADDLPMSRLGRVDLLRRFTGITNQVRGYHTLGEMLAIARAILARAHRPNLTVVEAGCGFGASTAKLSLAARAAGAHMHVFDSFRGIPPNDEQHLHLDGRSIQFRAGAYRGTLRSVERTLARHGAPEVCTLHKGLFDATLPVFSATAEIDVAVLDVDLIASTRTCVARLFPRMRPGSVMFSLDGQLRATHQLLADPRFWTDEVHAPPPRIDGLGTHKLLAIYPLQA